jgi:hypothetical protein
LGFAFATLKSKKKLNFIEAILRSEARISVDLGLLFRYKSSEETKKPITLVLKQSQR